MIEGILYALGLSVLMSLVAWKLSYEAFSIKKFARSVTATFLMALGITAGGAAFDVSTIYVNATLAPIFGLFLSKGLNYFKPIPTQYKGTLEELTKIVVPIADLVTSPEEAKIENPPEATEQ